MTVRGLLLLLALPTFLWAQPPAVLWTRTYGGPGDDVCNALCATPDGGYLLAGTTTSYGAGGQDMWLLKVDAHGDSLWSRTFGSLYDDVCNGLARMPNGNLLLIGNTVHTAGAYSDIWLMCTDANGFGLWSRSFGTPDRRNTGNAVAALGDTGVMIAGTWDWSDGLLLRLNAAGDSVWSEIFPDVTIRALQNQPGGRLVAGGYRNAPSDAGTLGWTAGFSSAGTLLWSGIYEGSPMFTPFEPGEFYNAVAVAAAGPLIFAGYTWMENNDCPQYPNFRLTCVTAAGQFLWQRLYPSPPSASFQGVAAPTQGGYAALGNHRADGDLQNNFFLLRTGIQGDSLWSLSIGDTLDETACALLETADHGFLLAGRKGHRGSPTSDFMLVRTAPERITPTVSFRPATLTFSEGVAVGESAISTLVIKNTGLTPYSLQSITLPTPFAAAIAIPCSLAIGDSVIVPVTFTPPAAEMYEGVLTVAVSDDANSHLLPLSGFGVYMPRLEWSRIFGLSRFEKFGDLQILADGQFVVAGGAWRLNGYDGHLMTLDAAGAIRNEFRTSTPDWVTFSQIRETPDHLLIAAGYIYQPEAFRTDTWVMAFDSTLRPVWQCRLGVADSSEFCVAMDLTADNGVVLALVRQSVSDFRAVGLAKLNTDSTILWQRTYRFPQSSTCVFVEQTADQGFLLIGSMGEQVWQLKTDAQGDSLWSRTCISGNQLVCTAAAPCPGGGYLLAGSEVSNWSTGYWIARIDADGDSLWSRTYGGNETEWLNCITVLSDTCYLVGGSRISASARNQAVFFAVDSEGDSLWRRVSQSAGRDTGWRAIRQTQQGDVVVGGVYQDYATSHDSLRVMKLAPTIWPLPVKPVTAALPARFALHTAYPNPFNPTTVIGFELPQAAQVKLVVFDLLGREVAVLENQTLAAGRYQRRFDAAGLASGVYFYRLEAGSFARTHKLIVLK